MTPLTPKQIRFNAFTMCSPVHYSPGLWRHPRDNALRYKDLSYWTELAKTLEAGLFDGIFFADGIGVNDVFGGDYKAAVRHAAQVPKNDPLMLIAAMAAVTEHLGFCATATMSYEPPFLLARRFSTLDHLTRGRIGWNIVTGYYDSGARAMGRSGIASRDHRYEAAEDYMELVYKLWEGSWEDGSVVADQRTGFYADPDKVHRIRHEGPHFRCDAIHMSEPSPQRTPVLFQAGSSDRGRDFAARHAECVFIGGPTPRTIAPIVADIRRRAALAGRNPAELLFFMGLTVTVGRSTDEARAKFDEYAAFVNYEGALALFSGWTGIDFSRHDPDAPLAASLNDSSSSSMIDSFTRIDPDRVWTLREVVAHNAIGGRGPVIVGDPESVADQIEAWVRDTDIDGFNLAYAITPDGYREFIELVVPVLQRRGRFKTSYDQGTLREKLHGSGRRLLADPHPGTGFRHPPALANRD